jgi:hypothetical protein
MSGCLLANTTTSTVTATVTLTNAGNTVTTNIVKNVIIPTGTALNILVDGSRVNVPQNYAVKVVATGAVDVTISATEVS